MATAITNAALQVLQAIAADGYLKASSEQHDNYNRVWARDAAVGAIAILAANQTSLFDSISKSLILLQNASNELGQIPSNVSIDENLKIKEISFGGPVGRTDANFWWIIATLIFLQKQNNEALHNIATEQVPKILKLADAWEFNGKHLMYVPMSSNWADEYVTNGYVLYDQILRYWALELAADYFKNEAWQKKAALVKLAIKQHFLVETELGNSLFTHQQKQYLQHFNIEQKFIASFSPGEIVNRYDGWSIALLLMLDIPSKATKQQLISVIQQTYLQYQAVGIPAFWPFIQVEDNQFLTLQFNHHYRFKNQPAHFHNGGIWPVVNGFIVAALAIQGQAALATQISNTIQLHLEKCNQSYPFAEYFDAIEAKPYGVKNLCYSASGFVLAQETLAEQEAIKKMLLPYQASKNAIYQKVSHTAAELLHQIVFPENTVTVLSVAGESGCGKTTMAKALKQLLEEKGYTVLILHQDDYFKLPPQKNHLARLANFNHIGINEVKLNLIDEHISIIKNKLTTTLQVPVMNWKTDTEEATTVNIENINIVIVEGTYTMLLQEVNAKVFITTNYVQTRKNRIDRNREAVTDFIEKVLEKESSIIQTHAVKANFWIDENLQLFTHYPF